MKRIPYASTVHRDVPLPLYRAQRDHDYAVQRWFADPNDASRLRERQVTFSRLLAIQWALALTKVTHE